MGLAGVALCIVMAGVYLPLAFLAAMRGETMDAGFYGYVGGIGLLFGVILGPMMMGTG